MQRDLQILSNRPLEGNVSPTVSVCVLTYNHEKYIRQTLSGLLMQQTNFSIEILIHDDASTDNTQDIIMEFSNKYPHIFKPVLQKQNQRSIYGGGMNPRFNYQRANGKYIALCEGDDYWTDPYKLQNQVDFLEKNPQYSICFTYSLKIDDQGNSLESIANLKQEIFTQYDFLIGRKYQTRTQTILFNKDYLNLDKIYKLNPKNKINGDTLLKIQLTDKQKLGIRLPMCTAVYRQHQRGVWSGLSKVELTKKYFYSWRAKLKITLHLNLRAFLFILFLTIKYFVKWKVYAFLKLNGK